MSPGRYFGRLLRANMRFAGSCPRLTTIREIPVIGSRALPRIMSVRFLKTRFRCRGGSIPSSPDDDKLNLGDRRKMQNLTPRHINKQESDNRSIKEGWYAMRRNG